MGRDPSRRESLEAIVEALCRAESLCNRDAAGQRVGAPSEQCLHALMADPPALERLLWWGQMPARHWAAVHEFGRDDIEVLQWLRRLSRPSSSEPTDEPRAGDGAA